MPDTSVGVVHFEDKVPIQSTTKGAPQTKRYRSTPQDFAASRTVKSRIRGEFDDPDYLNVFNLSACESGEQKL